MGHTEETRIREICRKLTADILASSVKHGVSVSGKIEFGNVSDPASSEGGAYVGAPCR